MNNYDDGKQPELVQSVSRAINILELLLREGDAGITDVADELGVHKSTASRLVYTLQAGELVEQQGERGRFTIGIGMLRFAGAVTGQIDLAKLGTPLCETLAEDLGETVNIAVLDGDVAINVGQARGTSAVAAQNWTGQRTPLHATSSGKILLATMDEQQREAVLAGELTAYTPRTIVDPDELRTTLERVAEDGYATGYEELEPGLHAVAVDVHGAGNDVVASISASGPAYRMSRKRIRQIAGELRTAATDLSGQLGYIRQ